MSSDESERRPRFLGRGVLTSLFIHTGLLFPLATLAFILGAREQAQREGEVQMTFEDVKPEDLPEDLPPIEQSPPAPPQQKQPELAQAEPPPQEPPPEQEPPPPPPPPQEQPPPPPQPQPEPPKQHEKSVDFEVEKEEESPNAKFLAEKNSKVEQETRAERTNLEKAQKGGEESSSPSERQDQNIGDDEDKVAKLDDVKSKLGRQAPNVTPHEQQSLQSSPDEKKRSLLSLRNNAARPHEITPETADPALPRDPDGVLAMPEDNLQSVKDLVGRKGSSAKTSLRLSSKQYEYVFGNDAEAAEQFASKEKSKKQGRFAQRMARVQSALENFIPEVKPGNQTALNTRAAPFAAFIARMHRSIHELWGFGFLEDLESKPVSHVLNDRNLVSKLEIVLNGDGTVDKVTVVRPSGVQMFDAAAIDTVYSAGPYPDPPRAIRSKNGKIYVHWSFHRDERQCATSGVDYFILDNPGPGSDVAEAAPGPAAPSGGPSASNGNGRGNGPAPGRGGGGEEAEPGPRRLERGLGGEPSGGGGEAPAGPRSPTHNQPQVARSDDPAARTVVDAWFTAFVKGDIRSMVGSSAFPFKSRAGVAAQSPGDLSRMLRELLSEVGRDRKLESLQVYTAAGVRSMLGGIPPGFGEGTGLLFAVGRMGGDTFVLVLGKASGQWRTVGLIRG